MFRTTYVVQGSSQSWQSILIWFCKIRYSCEKTEHCAPVSTEWDALPLTCPSAAAPAGPAACCTDLWHTLPASLQVSQCCAQEQGKLPPVTSPRAAIWIILQAAPGPASVGSYRQWTSASPSKSNQTANLKLVSLLLAGKLCPFTRCLTAMMASEHFFSFCGTGAQTINTRLYQSI